MEACKQSIGFEIGKMMRAVFREFKKCVTEHSDKKLTLEQFGLLYSIRQEPNEVIQTEMAEMLGKDKSSILRMIDSLEAKGMLRRVVDINDRRKNQIMVTKLGEQTLSRILESEQQLNRKLTEDIPKPDMEMFFSVADRIRAKAEQMSGQ